MGKTERSLLDGTAPTFREGRIHAIRVGDGVIVSGPGEVFSEIGMAVKERSPGRPTLYAGYTNELVAYFATSAEYGVYGLQAVAVIITFCIGIVLVPSLTSSIFSGHGGQAIVPGIPRSIRTRF